MADVVIGSWAEEEEGGDEGGLDGVLCCRAGWWWSTMARLGARPKNGPYKWLGIEPPKLRVVINLSN